MPDPGFELVLPQDEATTALLARTDWLSPAFVTEDLSLRVGSSALLVTTGSTTVLVDPWLAFDDDARFATRIGALRDAGVAPEDVDVVVNTHVDGIGANVDPGDGKAAFPRARYLVPAEEMAAVREGERSGAEALCSIDVEEVTSPVQVADRVALVDLPGHNDAHYGVEVTGETGAAVIVGHLFLHPAQVANPDVADLDRDPVLVAATRRALLDRCASDGTVLIGPLFESPGGGTVARDGDGYRLELGA